MQNWSSGPRGAAGTCNTGGSDTQVSLDYLVWTFPAEAGGLGAAQEAFGGQGMSWRAGDRGGLWYAETVRRGNITIYHDGNGGGATVVLTGQGCRQIETERGIGGESGWRDFLGALFDVGAKIARIDWALDDRAGLLDIETMRAAALAGECASRFRTADLRERIRLKDGSTIGNGIMFGSRSAELCVRAYDKALQTAGACAESTGQWVRVEIEAKARKAETLARAFIADGAAAVLADLRARLAFKRRRGADSNKSRWAVCEWWDAFLGGAAPRMVTAADAGGATDAAGLDRRARAVAHQFAPTLAVLMAAPTYGKAWFQNVIADGNARIQPRHIEMLVADALRAASAPP